MADRLGNQFATIIAAKLIERGMTQADLAREMGVSAKHINQMLTGKATGSPGMLDYAAHTLGFRWAVTANDHGECEQLAGCTPQNASPPTS